MIQNAHVIILNTIMVIKNRGCVKYKSIGTDYRASVDETSDYFKFFYSMRTESERYNSRFKNLNLEPPSVRNMRSIENQNTLGHIISNYPNFSILNSPINIQFLKEQLCSSLIISTKKQK